jgi:hypothetical protein
MELSFEIKSKVDLFIKELENTLMNQPFPNPIKLNANFGALNDYLISIGYYNHFIEFTNFCENDIDKLFVKFKEENPNFDEDANNEDLWDKWRTIRDNIYTYTICYDHKKQNPRFDYHKCDEDDNYNEWEEFLINLHLDYRNGIIILEAKEPY